VQPAAVFADLDNGSSTTNGNAIRAYTNNATSANLVSFYQESSAFSGHGLIMDFGNNSGSFSGNFLDLRKAGTTKFSVTDDGVTNLNLNATETTNGLCHSGTDVDAATDTQRDVVPCSAAPGDIAEWYETKAGVVSGDIVSLTDQTFSYTENNFDPFTGMKTGTQSTHTVAVMDKSVKAYDAKLFGIVSTSPYQTFGKALRDGGAQNPQPVAIKGRVLVKVSDENGPIKAGDYITSSATQPGFGMKATRSGQVVGQALNDYDFSSGSTGLVMVFVQVGYQQIGNRIVLDAPAIEGQQLQSGGEDLTSNAASTFVIQQQANEDEEAVSDILQLQSGDANRFMVSSTGATSILSNLNCELEEDSCPSVLKVTQANTELMNIDARGTLTLAGTIFIKDDSFAGSVATGDSGLAEITFSYHLGTGKPVVQLTVEAQIPVFAQILEFKQDEDGNYTGFVIKTLDLIASPVQAIVHYNVTGKQADYITLGEVVESSPENLAPIIIEGGEVVGGDFTPINPGEVSGVVSPEDPAAAAIPPAGEGGVPSEPVSDNGTSPNIP
jgi:hypothetical protein